MAESRPIDSSLFSGDDLSGRVLANRYRLLRSIGTGASGRVYEADDTQLKRRVAVKVLHQALADDHGFLKRFRAEAQVAASLHHPNILTVHDWGEDHIAFMVVELLTGGSLRAMLDGGSHLSLAQAARLGADLAGALEYAHVRGIVHRDIKPANLLFDEHAVVRIADFGLARALAEASWTEPAGAVFGTARYASPEQARGIALDARSDIYSLAIVLYEAISGSIPFAADTVMGTLAKRSSESIKAPVEWGPIRAIIERAGCLDPADRYPDAQTMASALRDACEALERPAPLVLAGTVINQVEDPHPTIAIAADPRRPDNVVPASTGNVFDQDAHTAAPTPSTADDTQQPKSAKRRARRTGRLVPVVIATVVVAVLGGGAYAARSLTGATAHTMPGVVGLLESQAVANAAEADIDLEIERREADDPAGVVIQQDPAAGVRASGALTIVVSSGPPSVTTPDLATLDRRGIKAAAKDVGLVPEFEMAHSETVEKGTVIKQVPAAGESAERDSVVVVTMSQGPAPRTVPEVSSDSKQANAALIDLGFTVTESKTFSDSVEKGLVIRTDPGAGTTADYGSTVTIVISKGPELVTVPNTFGLGINDACAAIEDAGLLCDSVHYSPGDVVSSMDPQPGEKLRRGDSVTLYF